jgi:rhodanese-related sulfurtransferase
LIVAAKFVPGLDGVTPPLAGAEGTSVQRFVLADSIGALLWSLTYSGIGFLFANQIREAAQIAHRFGFLLMLLVGVPLTCWIIWRVWTILAMIRELRFRRISPVLLHEKMEAGEKIAVIDLLSFEGHDETELGIPGSMRMSAERLKTGPKLQVPADVEIVLYCTTHQEITSARVAIALQRRGIRSVWILEGGLDAWRRDGFPVSASFAKPEELAHRLGIQLPPE